MKTYLALFCIVFLTTAIAAQDDKIATDRPSETQTPELTPQGFVQVEAGFRKEQINDADYKLLHPNGQIKYGLSKKLELRADVSGASEKEPSKNEFKYGLTPVQLGIKAALIEGHGALPQTSLYTMVGIPTLASNDHQAPHLSPRLRLLMENELSKQVHLGYNVGAEWNGEDPAPQWLATLTPQFSIGDHWDVFTEVYGKWQKGLSAEYVLDAGAGYFISNNTKLDVIGGKGLSHAAPDYFVAMGISFRVGR